IDTFNTNKVAEEKILQAIKSIFNLTPAGIIKQLDLLKPIYKKSATYGHFGREEEEFSWEKCDKIEDIRNFLSI
ncbi:methionine adenosyltransferase domain-containing protein, partial [Arcobacter venerupis]